MNVSRLIRHLRHRAAPESLNLRFVRDVSGIAAVELSLVLLPLAVLMLVIIEASFLVLTQHQLDLAVERTARLVRTGAFQQEANGADLSGYLRGLLCGSGVRLYRCDALRFDLVRTATFAVKQIAPAYDASRGDWAAGFGTQLSCPSGGSVHILRVAVPVMRPFRFLDFTGQRMPGGQQLLTATAVFRTEGYADMPCA
ncbi:hypothetical protein F8B43_3651 [Methylorubrum populi]|uniref:TadE-like domain-containing protein n=1 Tax=Methylorubrum populi TaxID=223967 RepID=A0A833J2Z5_9HYPH|nr:TadE/TadG family type IV pilus assembly protein [Methylorubrum populi]KAB7783728.1 hypothetical protein F8B43_3651 [Methylorubrum populi]